MMTRKNLLFRAFAKAAAIAAYIAAGVAIAVIAIHGIATGGETHAAATFASFASILVCCWTMAYLGSTHHHLDSEDI